VPLATDLAKTDEDRKVLKLFSTASALGYPMLTGQSVPADRVAILRQAFRETMGDPVFMKEAEKSRIDIVPMYGEEVQKAVEELLNYSPEIVAKAKAAMEQ
jgi:tripartite-type tricarboxylate transporter receptor subunit TctC